MSNALESTLIIVLQRKAFCAVSLHCVNRGVVFHQSLTGCFQTFHHEFLGVANKFSRFAKKTFCDQGKPRYKVVEFTLDLIGT